MASTSSLSSPNQMADSDGGRKRKKKVEKQIQNQAGFPQSSSGIQWNSNAQLQVYSSKLFQALQRIRMNRGGASEKQTWLPKRVRDAAYRALAMTAKGRSRWSQAIFSKPKLLKKVRESNQRRKLMRIIGTGNTLLTKKSEATIRHLKSKDLPDFERKARLLSRLIPGCRKQPLHVTLEETIDYIPALQMQVKAMNGLLQQLLSTTGSSSSTVPTFASNSNDVPSPQLGSPQN